MFTATCVRLSLDGATSVSYTHLLKLLPLVGNVFSVYDLSDDNFALSSDYDQMCIRDRFFDTRLHSYFGFSGGTRRDTECLFRCV